MLAVVIVFVISALSLKFIQNGEKIKNNNNSILMSINDSVYLLLSKDQ